MSERKSLPLVTVRLNINSRIKNERPIRNVSDAIELIKNELQDYTNETVMCLYMNTKNMPVSVGIISTGSINMSYCSPFQVLQTALLCNAPNMILFHNHPSGDPQPSQDDIRLTKQVTYAAALMGCNVLDHIIVGAGGETLSLLSADILDFNELSKDNIDVKFKMVAEAMTDNMQKTIPEMIADYEKWNKQI